MHGTSRSKIIPIDHVERYARDGLNMYGGTVVLDSRSDVVPGTLYNEEVAYADQLLRPDPRTAAVVPWADATARMICDTYWSDGRPLGAAPRHVFRRVLDRCHELGYELLMGVEPEFYLLDGETRQPLFERLPHLQHGPEHLRADDRADHRADARVRDRHHHRELRVRRLAVGDQLRARRAG